MSLAMRYLVAARRGSARKPPRLQKAAGPMANRKLHEGPLAIETGGLCFAEALDEQFAAGIEARLNARLVDVIERFMGDPDIGAGILHDFLHPGIDFGPLAGVELGKTCVPQILELRIGPALPVPDADLALDEPLDHVGRIRRCTIAH